MLGSDLLLKNIVLIQKIFKETKEFSEKENDLKIIINFLDKLPNRFQSIGYEAVAMVFALKDLEAGDELKFWSYYLEHYAYNHSVQVHIGLGWALAQKRQSPIKYLDNLDPMLRWRVVDGCGYYDGFFRRRKTLKGDFVLNFTGNELQAYTLGLGRSLWYITKGDVNSLTKIISTLPNIIHASLWIGIGIASTYTGGLGLKHFQALKITAGKYLLQFALGVSLCIWSRVKAKTIKNTIETPFNLNQSNFEVYELLESKVPSNHDTLDEAFFVWLETIENELKKHIEIIDY